MVDIEFEIVMQVLVRCNSLRFVGITDFLFEIVMLVLNWCVSTLSVVIYFFRHYMLKYTTSFKFNCIQWKYDN